MLEGVRRTTSGHRHPGETPQLDLVLKQMRASDTVGSVRLKRRRLSLNADDGGAQWGGGWRLDRLARCDIGVVVEATAAGSVRVRAKMASAVELAALAGHAQVDAALGVPPPQAGSPRTTCSRSCATAPPAPRRRSWWSPTRRTLRNRAPRPGRGSAWQGFGR